MKSFPFWSIDVISFIKGNPIVLISLTEHFSNKNVYVRIDLDKQVAIDLCPISIDPIVIMSLAEQLYGDNNEQN